MNTIKEKIEKHLLPFVEKPERYIGEELHSSLRKREEKVSIALAFPDVYEVGFSNLGLKILYHMINKEEKFLAERVYAPWFDCEELMRKESIPLITVESWTPVSEFDIIGFSLQHELGYTNIINMINMGGLPLLSSEREENMPLIIAGGPGTFNPAPLDDFIDLFVIGDGEEVLLEILEEVYMWKFIKKLSKIELLKKLTYIGGVYVPAFYKITCGPSGEITEIMSEEAPLKIEKRLVKDLDKAFYPQEILTPLMEVIHDRAVIELFRGCTRGCRFCQAGYIYRPVRERTLSTCMEQAKNLLHNTGYSDLSLSSLSTTDYSNIEKLVRLLIEDTEKEKIALSIPSMRIDTFSADLAAEVRKTGFTFAPEAGSERLRRVINKQVTEEDLIKSVETALSMGWEKLKLYFMIGLPSETYDDLEEIIRLIKKVMTLGENYKIARLSVSFASFIPKPHTPFQWESQDTLEILKEKQNWLFKNLKGRKKEKKLFISFHNTEQSLIEAVFARGDRRLGEVLKKAWEAGCRFDNWSDYFRFDLWKESFRNSNISPSFYANRKREEKEIFPWDHISSGVSRKFLLEEKERAFEGKETGDCRFSPCSLCGVCQKLEAKNKLYPESDGISMSEREETKISARKIPEKIKIRMVFKKIGKTKFISHLGLIRIIERAVRFTGFPVAFSEGFNPKPKIAMGPPLSSGLESYSEWVDIIMKESVDIEIFQREINKFLPRGMKVLKACVIPLNSPALNAIIKISIYRIDALSNKQINKNKIEDFLKQEKILFKKVRKKSTRIIDIKPLIKTLEIISLEKDKISLEVSIKMEKGGTIKPQELIEEMNTSGIDLNINKISRINLLTEEGKLPISDFFPTGNL